MILAFPPARAIGERFTPEIRLATLCYPRVKIVGDLVNPTFALMIFWQGGPGYDDTVFHI